jgi:hypothetical protein
LEKGATGFASAEIPRVSRHWQSQWHSEITFSTGCYGKNAKLLYTFPLKAVTYSAIH